MTEPEARSDLAFIRDVMRRTEAHVDPHAFHYVHWGVIVLIWYPLSNWLCATDRVPASVGVSIGAVVLGIVIGAVREARLAKAPRLEAENTFVSTQVMWIAWINVGAGIALSSLGPALRIVASPYIPVIWGFVYANMALMTGIVYRREFIWSGLGIFVGCLLALKFPLVGGYILGPAMGLGMIIPGLMAERRVRQLAQG